MVYDTCDLADSLDVDGNICMIFDLRENRAISTGASLLTLITRTFITGFRRSHRQQTAVYAVPLSLYLSHLLFFVMVIFNG